MNTNDPHGYISDTRTAVTFAVGLLTGGALVGLTILLAGVLR